MKAIFLMVPFLLAGTLAAHGQLNQPSSVLNASGNRVIAGSLNNISVVGQPGGIAVATGGSIVNYAGFLSTFSLQPSKDTDGDGLADEVDPDNDNDALTDTTELAGTAFDPNIATEMNNGDSDGDSMSDGEEAASGTNPHDANAVLSLRAIDADVSGARVTWIGRGDKTYDIYTCTDLADGFDTLLMTTNATGGVEPWYVTTNSFVDTTALTTNMRFYLIRVRP